MSEPRKKRAGKAYLDGKVQGTQWVGFLGEKPSPPDYAQYRGPMARISFDKDWLHIVTDDYEGHVMLNIETLPYLRRALAKIAKELRP